MSDMDMKNEIEEIDELSDEKVEREEVESTDCPPISGNLKVPFCCVTTMPKGFDLKENNLRKWLVYDVSCLHCCLEPCELPIQIIIQCCDGPKTQNETIPGYSVKIVGCIKYMAAAFPVKGADGTTLCGGQFTGSDSTSIIEGSKGKGLVCCQGCECVDKVIGCISCGGTCNCECPDIDCSTVTVENFQVTTTGCGEQKLVRFRGKFVIPGCKEEE